MLDGDKDDFVGWVQVVDLQEQLISLKKLAANQSNLNDSMASAANPNDRSNNITIPSSLQDVHNWFHYSQNPTAMAADFYPASSNACNNGGNLQPAAIYYSNINENPIYMGTNINISNNNYSYADASSSSMDDLQSAAFRFLHHWLDSEGYDIYTHTQSIRDFISFSRNASLIWCDEELNFVLWLQ